jgi:hypothetical protein
MVNGPVGNYVPCPEIEDGKVFKKSLLASHFLKVKVSSKCDEELTD